MKKHLFGLLLLLTACGGGGGSAPPPNYQPPLGSGWTQFFGNGVIIANDGFDFPATPGSVHYIVGPGAPKLGQTITLTFQITGNGTLLPDPNDVSAIDTPPPHVRLFLWERGDNLTGQGAYETYREWCNASAVDISNPGSYTSSCKIDPSLWTGVFGLNPSAAAFQQLLNNFYGIGYTFGGASFAGHGLVSANGQLHFQVLSFTVQ